VVQGEAFFVDIPQLLIGRPLGTARAAELGPRGWMSATCGRRDCVQAARLPTP